MTYYGKRVCEQCKHFTAIFKYTIYWGGFRTTSITFYLCVICKDDMDEKVRGWATSTTIEKKEQGYDFYECK